MKINVHLFGPYIQVAGADTILVNISSSNIMCNDLMNAIRDQYPDLAPYVNNSRLAINHTYAQSDQLITPDEEIALIGLVSGG
ncbi:MoaD/ThiS family protein [Planctomycetota bacterium]|nr:MoaD/ThiS family protein [Planctomycetota bacterium]